jgi:predicted dehydrogenase
MPPCTPTAVIDGSVGDPGCHSISKTSMRFAIIGCGYVADFYVRTLRNHANIELAGVFDRDANRARHFSDFYGVPCYGSLEAVLEDPTIHIVANLTNPRSHYGVSRSALEAGKHVYSEKPLAIYFDEAKQLVDLSRRRGLLLTSAPCNLLSETAQTVWKALREQQIGTPRLAYAEIDDGIIFQNYDSWVGPSGTPWPYKDEFETGCTLEHAGYYVGWLTAFFGPAKRVVSFANVIMQRKRGVTDGCTPDLVVGCVEFASGTSARITCGVYPTRDHSLRIFGDEGVLTVPDCWDYGAPVYIDRRVPTTWQERHPRGAKLLRMRRPALPLVRDVTFSAYSDGAHRMDFSRGIAELAEAVVEKREPRLTAQWSLHVNEVVLAMANTNGQQYDIQTTFEPLHPMPWAQ